jgi:hypothetical protein
VRKSLSRRATSAKRLTAAAAAFDSGQAPASRPLAVTSRGELDRLLHEALAQGDGATGAHCVHELWMRGEFAANIEAALGKLWQCAAASIPEWLPMRYVDWLPVAYEVAAQFQPLRRGRSNVYLVLLDFEDRNRGPHGVYVGMSQYSAAQRFDQHKAGIHAAGSVLKRGIEVLTGPVLHLQRIARAEALRIEAQLAAALADAGLLVEGGH